jgi:myosin heavy subunit
MFRKGLILLPILIVLVIISLLAAGGVFYLYQKVYAQNVKLQGQITELENLQRDTAGKLDASKKLATDLELQLQEAKSKIDALGGELTAEKAAHTETTGQLEQLKADLDKQKSVREDLEKQLNQVQDEGKQTKEQIRIMQTQKMALEAKIKNLETGEGGVELGTVTVNPESPKIDSDNALNQFKITNKKDAAVNTKAAAAVKNQPAAALPKGLEGKVMIVNKEFNFVVINLGSKDKVSVGDEFAVSRAGKPVGDLKIEKVHEAMSAAGFASELKDLIKENDLVIKKTK